MVEFSDDSSILIQSDTVTKKIVVEAEGSTEDPSEPTSSLEEPVDPLPTGDTVNRMIFVVIGIISSLSVLIITFKKKKETE